MSKMGEELERRLDENKYELWVALKACDVYFSASCPENMGLKQLAVELMDAVITKIEG